MNLRHNLWKLLAFMGGAGWLMLLVPELHFLYKNLIPALGEGKYLAFIIMGYAMFFCLPVVLIRKVFSVFLPERCESPIEKVVMGILCFLFVLISRALM